MSNISMNSSAINHNSSNDEQTDFELLEQKVQDLYENDQIQYLGISDIARIARDCKTTSSIVQDCIKNLRQENKEKIQEYRKQNELNGASGYFYGESHISSRDSMSNMCNYSNWIRTLHGIK